jgi:hypothetical protein
MTRDAWIFGIMIAWCVVVTSAMAWMILAM